MGIPGINLPGKRTEKPPSENTCTNCNTTYQTDFYFCPNCGSNLTLPKQMSIEEISYKDTVEEKYFEMYQQLSSKVDELSWLDAALKQQQQAIKSLEIEITRLNLDIERLNEKIKEEKTDVENLEKLTWTSFKARITGKHSEVMKKEEEDYLEALQSLKESEKELVRTKDKLKRARYDLSRIEEARATRESLRAKIKEVIFKATKGIRDPIEDKIELKINELVKELDPYTVKKSRIQTAYSLMQMAQEYLRNAMIIVDEDKETQVRKNALLVDILTKEEVSGIKSTVKDATSFINQAYEIMKQETDGVDLDGDGIHKGLFEGQGLWERFMRSFMKDLKAGFRKKEQTKEQLSKSLSEVNRLLSWLNSLLNEMNVKIDEFMTELKGLESDLIRERRRIFQEQLNKR